MQKTDNAEQLSAFLEKGGSRIVVRDGAPHRHAALRLLRANIRALPS